MNLLKQALVTPPSMAATLVAAARVFLGPGLARDLLADPFALDEPSTVIEAARALVADEIAKGDADASGGAKVIRLA